MAIIQRSKFALLLAAMLSASVSGQTNINFDPCGVSEDKRGTVSAGSFNSKREGSERRTYGNLCTGTDETDSSDDSDIDSRIGHPFREFCNLIDRYDNVKALLSTGNSPHTIFAPTDAAFSKVRGLIDRVDEQRLLELHILPQARLSRDLRCGQTYRTINTQQDRRNNQRSKTRCINAMRAQQLGPGNVVNGLKPTIGVPGNVFNKEEFESQDIFKLSINANADNGETDTFSEDVISCNGVIHVVDEVLLPGGSNAFRNAPYYGGPGPSAYYGHGGPSTPNYYGGSSHTHGAPGYYSGYYGAPPPPPYYGGYPPPRPYGKGGKGAKGFRPRPNPNPFFFRKLEGEEGADADEKFMTDAEFFGTAGAEDGNAKEETANRKRRLEALLEPDGTVKV